MSLKLFPSFLLYEFISLILFYQVYFWEFLGCICGLIGLNLYMWVFEFKFVLARLRFASFCIYECAFENI